MLGGFGKTRGVNRSSLFSDGMSKGVSKLSEIGNTPDSKIKRSSTGKHTVETDGSGRTANVEEAKEMNESSDSIVVDIAIMFYENDSVVLQKKKIHKNTRNGRFVSEPFVESSDHDFRVK